MAKNSAPAATLPMSIEGLVFDVTAPYAEGHTITAAEAKALNQVRKENIGNNVRKRIKDVKGDAESFTDEQAAEAASIVSEVDAGYEFSLTATRSTTSKDPLEAMCTRLAREAVNGLIQSKGLTVKAYKEENPEKYEALISQAAEKPQIVELAKERIAQRDALANIDLG